MTATVFGREDRVERMRGFEEEILGWFGRVGDGGHTHACFIWLASGLPRNGLTHLCEPA